MTITERTLAFAARSFSDKGLTRKASLNALAAGLDYSARFAVSFFVTPILVAGLGDAMYGVWTVINRMTGYLTAAGGRSSQALKWFVVNRQASSNVVEKRDGVGAAVVVWLLFIPLQVVLGACVVVFLPSWLNVVSESHTEVRIAAAIVIAGLIARGVVDVPRSVLEGENLGYKRMWISVVIAVAGGFLTVLAIRANLGVVGIAVASITTVVFGGAAFLLVVRHHVPWFGVNKPEGAAVRRFVGLSGWFMAWTLVLRVMRVSDAVILGIFASTELVASYVLLRYLPNGLLRFVTIAVFQAIPGFGRIYSSGDLSRCASVRGEIMRVTWLAGTVAGATVLLWNNHFLRLWVGPEYTSTYFTTLLIVVMVMQFAWIRVDANFINLTLELKEKVSLGAISACISVFVAIVLVSWVDAGIAGVCSGFILGRSILSVRYPVIIGRALGVSFAAQARGVIRPALVTIVLFATLGKVAAYVDFRTWMALALGLPATGLVFLGVSFFAGFSLEQRKDAYRRIVAVVNGESV